MLYNRTYQAKEVVAVQQLHHHILEQRLSYPSLFAELNAYAINLQQHYQMGNPAVSIEIAYYHPNYIACTPKEIFAADLSLTDFQITIARTYGFDNWQAVHRLMNVQHQPNFEMAIDILLTGRIDVLEDHLKQFPQVLHQRSAYGHRAGLIHYLASNGVEIWRQTVPLNLKKLLAYLLQNNCDPHMQAKLYGENSLLPLLITSDHAWKAGVAKEAISLLKAWDLS